MYKLLSAEFVRLFKSLIFKLCLLFSSGLAVFVILMRWMDVKMNPKEYAVLEAKFSNADGLIFVGGLYLIFAVAVLIGIFVGTEYSDGTLRNKLTAGHTRSSIYLSKLLVCAVADITIHIVYIGVALAAGKLLLNGTTMKARELLAFSAVSTAAVLSLTALLLLFSMSIQNKAAGSVVCLLTTLILLFGALTIWQRLDAPEYYDSATYTNGITGETITTEKEKNPKYLTGAKRKVYEFLNDFLPVSQLYQIAAGHPERLGIMVLYDGIILLGTTGAGIVIFKKKNLK